MQIRLKKLEKAWIVYFVLYNKSKKWNSKMRGLAWQALLGSALLNRLSTPHPLKAGMARGVLAADD